MSRSRGRGALNCGNVGDIPPAWGGPKGRDAFLEQTLTEAREARRAMVYSGVIGRGLPAATAIPKNLAYSVDDYGGNAHGAGASWIGPDGGVAAPSERRSGGERSRSGWLHPDGIPLAELEVGAWYDGIVSNVFQFGVFVDLGASKDALLEVPTRINWHFKRGMQLNVNLFSVDLANERVVVTIDENEWPESTPRRAQNASRTQSPSRGKSESDAARRDNAANSKAFRRPASAPPRGRTQTGIPRNFRPQPNMEDRVPLEELSKGTILNGIVKNVGTFGIFFDIGAQGDARLVASQKKSLLFRRGDIVENLHVDWVDTELRRIQVSIENLESSTNSYPMARTGVNSEAVPHKPPTNALARLPLEELEEGMIVDGRVRNKTDTAIWVDIGYVKDAQLHVAWKVWPRIERGDEILGMLVTSVDLQRRWIVVSLDDPEIAHDVKEVYSPQPKLKTKQAAKVMALHKKNPAAKPGENIQSSSSACPTMGYKPGSTVDGEVTRVTASGVFVNIGARADGILLVPPDQARQMRRGDAIQGMRVEYVDPSSGKISLSLEDPLLDALDDEVASLAAKTPRKARQKAKQKQMTTTAVRATPVRHPDLQKLSIGQECVVIVTRLGVAGVFLDFGAGIDGRLKVSKADAKKFQLGDQVEGVIIEDVDIAARRVTLGLPYQLGDQPFDA